MAGVINIFMFSRVLKLEGVLKPLALKIAGDLDRYIPQPYADEMRGVSEKWKIGLGYVVLGNIFYDIEASSDDRLYTR